MLHIFTSRRFLGLLMGSGLMYSTAQGQTKVPLTPASPAAASAATASLSGQVVAASPDGQGTPQAEATLILINLNTSVRRTVITDANGRFVLTGLAAGGPYIVQVRQPGFRTQSITNVFLKADQPTDLAVVLNVETVGVGTRRDDRTALASAVPVDVVDVAALARTAPQTDLTQLLHYSVAAFNSTRQTAAGGSDHVDPSNLRGLGTDQLLVLVNGKRRHTTALVNVLGNRGLGNVGTDLNTLPSLGVERVEVLRDGAAAQYGSDAIAGVMNINLKSDNHAGSVLASTGVTTAGDGLATLLGVNKGFRLGEKGFLNLTADADYRDRTTRGYRRDPLLSPVFVANNPAAEQAALAAAGKTYADFEQRNGDARVFNGRGLVNARLVASDQLAFYAFGGYNYRRGQAATLWVLPASQPNDVIPSLYPYGFQPQVNTTIHDGAATVGAVLGRSGPNHWTLDLSNTSGYNYMNYGVSNTLNASLGKDSPTGFADAGGFSYFQNVSNATASRLFDKVLAGTNVAVGAEFRTERYAIRNGDERAEAKYDDNYAGAQGAQGFSGFGDASKVTSAVANRRNLGVFLDVEADVTKRWVVSGAVRYENYSNFGQTAIDNAIYKFTTRYQVAKFLAVRAATNTGFRAPSLQQVFYRQITQQPGVAGVSFSGLFNYQNDITKALGINSLTPEKSRSYSAGFVVTPAPALSLSVDGYWIEIKNRITLSGLLSSNANRNANIGDAFTSARVTQAQFFTNDLDTRTVGLDVVANYRHALGRGQLGLSAAANFTRTDTLKTNTPPAFRYLQNDDNPSTDYIGQRQLSLITTGSPASKILLSLSYTQGKVGLTLRNTYFGAVSYQDVAAPDSIRAASGRLQAYDQGNYLLKFDPRLTTDLLVSFQATRGLSLTLGAQNLFNVKPNTIDEAASNGTAPGSFGTRAAFEQYIKNRYGVASPFPANRDVYPYAPVQMGFNGTFVYLKAVYNLGI